MDRKIRVWSVAEGKQVREILGHPDPVFGLAITPAGDKLVSSGYAGNIIIWNAADGARLHSVKPAFGGYSVAISPNGKTIVSGHENGHLYATPIP